jgi:TolA-binding protein
LDGLTGKRLWEANYNESLDDIFAIQTNLSEKITSALRAKLSENERRLIAYRPTENTAAYYLYLEARALDRKLGFYGQKKYEDVIKLCERAVNEKEGDPKFAEAYAQLSLAHSALYRFSDGDPSPERLEKAVGALQLAERVAVEKKASELPETRLARGVIYYLRDKNWDDALVEFREAEKELPNDEQVQWWIGNALRRRGDWDDAIYRFKSSSPLNPFAPGGGITAVQAMRSLRRFGPARDYARSLLQRFPENHWLRTEFAKCQFELDGNRAAFLAYLDNMMASDGPGESKLIERKYESAFRRGDWAEANRMLSSVQLRGISENPDYLLTPVALHRALVAFLGSQPRSMKTNAEEALAIYQKGNWNSRQQPWALMGQARAYALLGQKDEALKYAGLAWIEVTNKDAADEAIMRSRLAEVYLILGLSVEALSTLAEMMKLPSDIGPQALRADPLWARVKEQPKFEELLRSAKSYEGTSR